MTTNSSSPDYRTLCAELLKAVDDCDDYTLTEGATAAQPPAAELAEPEPEVGLTRDELWAMYKDAPGIADDFEDVEHFVRAVLARLGHQPAPPAAVAPGLSMEDVAPLVAWLTEQAHQAADASRPIDAGMLTWAAQVIGERVDEDAPAPPVEGEVGELVAALRRESSAYRQLDSYRDWQLKLARAADLLEQQATACAICERERLHQSTRAADLEIERHPAPVPVAAGEVEELVALLRYEAREADLDLMTAEQCHRAADLLERLAPVPVAERLPGPEDCDAEGFCWFWSPEDQCWFWERQDSTFCRNYGTEFHWLPATALPLPQGRCRNEYHIHAQHNC